MSDNTSLPPGTGGDTLRTLDKTGSGSPKTEVVALDLGGGDGRPETLLTLPVPIALAEVPVDDDGFPQLSLSPSSLDAIEMLFRQTIASNSYAQTTAEASVNVVPVNAAWAPGIDLRYGVIRDDATDNQTALTNMILACGALNGPICTLTGGVARHSGTLNWGFTRLIVNSDSDSFLRHTGTGVANAIDGGVSPGQVENLFLDGIYELGNSGTTYCWDIRSVHRSQVRLYAKNCTLSGFRWRFGVLNRMQLMCSQNDSQGNFTTTPVNGVIFDVRNAGEYVAWSYPSILHMAGVSGTGWVFQTSTGTAGPTGGVYSGSSEGNGSGISTDASCRQITFMDIDCEANTSSAAGADFNLQGQWHQLINTNSVSSAATDTTALTNSGQITFTGGYHRSVNVGATALDTLFTNMATSDNASLGIHGSGTWRNTGIVKYNTSNVATARMPDIYGPASSFTTLASRQVFAMNASTDLVIDFQVGGTSVSYYFVSSASSQLQSQSGTVQLLPGNTLSLNALVNGDIIARGVAICLRATAAETRTSTTTLTNSTQLTYAVPAAGTYALKLVVFFYGTTAGTNGITANVNYSGTFTANGSYLNGYYTNGTTTTTGVQPAALSAAVATAIAGLSIATTGSIAVATPCVYVIEGNLIATGTGTVAFAFAQNSSGTNTTNLGVGSYMTVTKLS